MPPPNLTSDQGWHAMMYQIFTYGPKQLSSVVVARRKLRAMTGRK